MKARIVKTEYLKPLTTPEGPPERKARPEPSRAFGSIDMRAAAYAFWRFDAWLNGHGSYNEIDEKVRRGELVPGQPVGDL